MLEQRSVSVRPSDRPSVTSSFFSLLGATNALYTALLQIDFVMFFTKNLSNIKSYKLLVLSASAHGRPRTDAADEGNPPKLLRAAWDDGFIKRRKDIQ